MCAYVVSSRSSVKGRGSSCAVARLVRRCLAPRRIELKSATSMRAGKRDARCAASSKYLAHVGRRSVVGATAAAALRFSEPSCA